MKFLRVILGLMVVCGFCSSGDLLATAEGERCFDTRWPSELSDLERDPSLVRGVLDNGFRYVIKHNEEPDNRVAVYLNIQAGSLHESDDQSGLAHFLEHLMFNGSVNFPPGSLVDYFQSIGMSFGGDTNAHTSYDETVYRLILPGGTADDLNAGFVVIADYARGALLLEEEIERERGVILAEKRARDSAGYRVRVAETAFAFRGTKYPSRMIIGDEKVLESADRSLLRSYYDAWYRPENMILVVVGDTDTQLAETLITQYFSKLSAAGQRPACPDFGNLDIQGVESFYHHEPELGRTDVSLQTFWDVVPENDSRDLQKRELEQYIGTRIMGYRLEKLLETEDLPFGKAQYYAGNIINRIGYGSLIASTDGDNWQESVGLLVRTLQQALRYGFLEQEVERAKKEILAGLDEKNLTQKTRDSRRIAREIIRHVNSNRVYLSPTQEKELYGSIVDQIRLKDVNSAFQKVWGGGNRLISVTGDAQPGKVDGEVIDKVYQKALHSEVLPLAFDGKGAFPYLHPPAKSQPLSVKRIVERNGIERFVYSNGLRVNLKKTEFDDNRFLLSANFGKGEQEEKLPGMAMLAEAVVNASGSGRYPQSEIDALVSGSSIEMSFQAGETFFSWGGSGLVRDFELFSQLLYTMLFDIGFRENVFTRVKENYELMYQKIGREIEGADPLHIQPFLAGYNKHFGLPPWRDLEAIPFDHLASWVKSYVRPTDLEISLVGDFDRDDILAVLEKYFGGGVFTEPLQPETAGPFFPAGKRLEISVSTSLDKSLITVAWPTDDFWDIHRTRRLHLLAAAFGDRLRKTIREKLGASYSPSVSSYGSRAYKGYGYIKTQMVVHPGIEDVVVEEILNISRLLQKNGISSDELMRAREPILTALAESLETNRYWLHSVLSLSNRHPRQLQWPETVISDYRTISLTEVNELATKYLHNSKAAVARAVPGEPGLMNGSEPADAAVLSESGATVESP